MTRRILQAIVHVPKQGIEHHLQMVQWCDEIIGSDKFQWFGYDVGAYKTTLFHFLSTEDSTAFVIKWGGKAEVRRDEN